MVKKVEGFVTHDGRMFLNEEAAVWYEVIERLCQVLPELQMIRPRVESHLEAIVTAVGPMVELRSRVPSPGPFVELAA